jgi:midasin
VLEPQLSQQLQGDYRTGKRLNMKKVISFIASHYRNDKIWLRRTMPSKRDYKILIAIDDSLSMKEQRLGFFSLEAMVTLIEALNRLEVGKIAVARIGDRMELLQSFEDSYSNERTAFIVSQYEFSHSAKTSHDFAMANFVRDANKLLDVQNAQSQIGGSISCPFTIVLSDGRFNKQNVARYMQEATEKRYLYIFVILDVVKEDAKGKGNAAGILSLKSAVKQEGKEGIKIVPYLKDFPFSYYCIVRDLH